VKKTYNQALPLLEALQQLAPESSNNTLRTWVKDGRILVDGTPIRSLTTIAPGQTIEIVEKRIKKQGPLDIIYEDPHLVVINKPSGLLSVSSNFEAKKTVHAHLKDRYPKKKVFVVHRLDQETSGVMMFALTEAAYHAVKAELATHKMERVYYGVVEGTLSGKGTWDSYLYEDDNYYVRVTKDRILGERAVTHYEAEKNCKNATLVRFQLQTGKKNQIRVHASHAGHPIMGDIKYGAKEGLAKRLLLHAYTLSFIHPATKKKMSFTAQLPPEFLQKFS
jgi:tRNA pseudouridine32 synthase/23S rRNA pseudouridine746 synthase/23S rRNA pseudouridine1911/1915/1917 synthase